MKNAGIDEASTEYQAHKYHSYNDVTCTKKMLVNMLLIILICMTSQVTVEDTCLPSYITTPAEFFPLQ